MTLRAAIWPEDFVVGCKCPAGNDHDRPRRNALAKLNPCRAGYFHFHLGFSSNVTPGDPVETAVFDLPFPSIFTARQQQIGLKVEAGKGPREFLVVDHLEKPSAN